MERTVTTQHFIDREIDKALEQSGLAHNHPMRPLLDEGATITKTREPHVLTTDDSGRPTSLRDRIEELKSDSRFSKSVPHPHRVAKNDMHSLKENFQHIVAGTVIVE